MSVVANLTIFPVGDEMHLSKYVARALAVIQASGLAHQLGPMGTAIEGEFDEVMAVASRCMKALEKDCERIYMTLAVDNRKGSSGRLDGKVQSVRRALGEE